MDPLDKKSPVPRQGGAYLLHLNVKKTLTLKVGSLGNVGLPAGHYVYVGSARNSIHGRINRHRRLAATGVGKLHWHIDYVLTHPEVDLIRADSYTGYRECAIAKRIASMKSASTPVLRFGSSDCRSGCKAHLFRVGKSGSGRYPAIRFKTQQL